MAFIAAYWPLILLDVFKILDSESQGDFRSKREATYGATLEEMERGREVSKAFCRGQGSACSTKPKGIKIPM